VRAGGGGELVHRGPLVALGYWNDPDRTAQRFRPLPGLPDWQAPELAVWSGDTVVADEEGFLYFVGRTDEMIKTSGYRVSPTEIEEAAYSTGMVRDAVALGIPEEGLGHRVVLAAAGERLEPAELLKALRRELPLFMVPAEVVVREELPRSPNGKFDRVALAGEVAAELAERTGMRS
jgi:acyl-CoA synthetase (AMP-forming)/AMP-acid ligase II